MPLLRFILTAVVALGALVAALFAGLLLLVTGLIAAVTGGARRRQPTRPRGSPVHPSPGAPRGEIIDVEATRVPDDPPPR